MDGSEILQWQQLIREVILAPHVQDYIVRLVLATHPEGPFACRSPTSTCAGAQPARRADAGPGGQGAGAARRPLQRQLRGRAARVLARMRHRVILNFEAQAEGIDTDHVLLEILEKLPEKAGHPI
jgi:MoxR-like ATPase